MHSFVLTNSFQQLSLFDRGFSVQGWSTSLLYYIFRRLREATDIEIGSILADPFSAQHPVPYV